MNTAHEIIAKCTTTDGISVAIWSDGLVTDRLGARTCMVRLPLGLIAGAPEALSRYTWAQLPGVIRSIKKTGKLPISPVRSAEIAESNAAARMAAARREVENDRTIHGVGLRRLGY